MTTQFMAQTRSYMKPQRPRFGVGDVFAGVSVALMVIPQSLAYAEVAGMPAYTGLYAAALPSIVSAFFASSPYLQTGPVALTSLLTFSALSPLATPGSPAYIGLAALLALIVGAGRIGIGLAKFGAVVSLMSQPVLAGFASAAAFLIVTSQLPTAVGVPDPGGGEVTVSLLDPGAPAGVGADGGRLVGHHHCHRHVRTSVASLDPWRIDRHGLGYCRESSHGV